MMKHLLKTTFLLLALLMPTVATAYDFMVDGIYYNKNGNEVTVTYENSNLNSYTDSVSIPESVTYQGVTYSVTEIGPDAFRSSSGLEVVKIPSSITLVGDGAFWKCSNLKKIHITDLEAWCKINFLGFTANPLYEGHRLFLNGEEVQQLTIPSSITAISNSAFCGCTSLKNVVIPNTVTTIGWYAFRDCSNLRNITIPNSIIFVGIDAFNGTYWLNNRPDGIVYTGSVVYKYKGTMPNNCELSIKDGIFSITENAFQGCNGLKSIQLPNSLVLIDTGVFSGCSGLSELILPNSLKIIGYYSFANCTSLTSVDIPSSVDSIAGYAFRGCANLSNLSIPDHLANIGGYAFEGTAWFNNQPDGLVYAGSAAYRYKGSMLEGTHLIIKDGTKSISDNAFSDCNNLYAISIPNSIVNIGYCAFDRCTNLRHISIPEGVTIIKQNTFRGCHNLLYVSLPNSLKAIQSWAFSSCNVWSLNLPESLSELGASTFSGCQIFNLTIPASMKINDLVFYSNVNISNLFIKGKGNWDGGTINAYADYLFLDKEVKSLKGRKLRSSNVVCYETTPPICDDNSFAGFEATLHVPSSAVSSYFTAPYWCNFSSIIGDADKPESVTLSEDTCILRVGEMFKIEASILPETALPNNVMWCSSDLSVARIWVGSGYCKVEGMSVGECDAFAFYLDRILKCHIVVEKADTVITLDKHELRLKPNQIATLIPSATPSLPELVVTSNDNSIAAARLINGKIEVVGISDGNAIITVSSTDGSAIPDTCKVIVNSKNGDVNGDGVVNIADINSVINMILSSRFDSKDDVNGDGVINIADINGIINIILNN